MKQTAAIDERKQRPSCDVVEKLRFIRLVIEYKSRFSQSIMGMAAECATNHLHLAKDCVRLPFIWTFHC